MKTQIINQVILLEFEIQKFIDFGVRISDYKPRFEYYYGQEFSIDELQTKLKVLNIELKMLSGQLD